MYSLQIRFKLLNKSCNRQELSDNLNIGSISIMSDEQSPFSVIIQGYRSEEEAQKTVDEIRAGNVIIPPKGSKENPFIQIPGNMPDDFIIVEKHNPQNTYTLRIDEFNSPDEALCALGKIQAGFCKFMLERKYAYQAIFDNPQIVNSEQQMIADNGNPIIFETGQKFPNISGGEVRVQSFTSSQVLIRDIDKFLKTGSPINDEKLKLAFDIYRLSFYDDVPSSRFLNLINILEVLALKKKKDSKTLELIDSWEAERKERLQNSEKGSAEEQSLKDLKSTLLYGRDQSIRSSIYDFVLSELNDTDKATAAKKWYDVRSHLVHDGTFEKPKGTIIPIETIIEEILKKKLTELFH